MLSMIVAFDSKQGIGIDNKLPWHIPEDLKFFKNKTSGNTIVMGRNTYDSIGKALPNRRNIVLSSTLTDAPTGCELAISIDHLETLLRPSEKVFVIGGAKVYEQLIDLCDTLYVTYVYRDFKCDTFFPEIPKSFDMSVVSQTHCQGDLRYSFLTYKNSEKSSLKRYVEAEYLSFVNSLIGSPFDPVLFSVRVKQYLFEWFLINFPMYTAYIYCNIARRKEDVVVSIQVIDTFTGNPVDNIVFSKFSGTELS